MSKPPGSGKFSATGSTPFLKGHYTPKGRTFREETLRGRSPAVAVRRKDEYAELKDRILGSTVFDDAIKNYQKLTSCDAASSIAILENISAQLSSSLEATTSRIQSLCAEGLATKALPSIEEVQFDTGPKRLVLNLNQLLDEFGKEEIRKVIPKVNPRDLDLYDKLGSFTATMVELTETAKEIHDFNSNEEYKVENRIQ